MNEKVRILHDEIISRIVEICDQCLPNKVACICMSMVEDLIKTHGSHSIITWCTNINLCLKPRWMSGDWIVKKLTLAHTLGWLGYTLLDDINDGDREFADPRLVWQLANWLAANSKRIFLQQCHSGSSRNIIDVMFRCMDQALVSPPATPGSCWRKSAGIICAPYILLQGVIQNGTAKQKKSTKSILNLIKLYLCLRQTNDDYIDCRNDLEQGLLTPFSVLLGDGASSRFRKSYFLAYRHAHLEQAKMVIVDLKSTENTRYKVLTSVGIDMLEKLVFGE